MMVTRREVEGTGGTLLKVYRLATRRWISSEDLMHNIVNLVNNCIMYFNIGKRIDLKCSHYNKEIVFM